MSKNKELVDLKEKKKKLIIFVSVFAIIVSSYYIGIASDILTPVLSEYTKFNAWLAHVILNILGENATQSGFFISSPRFQVTVGIGCEGSEPITLYLAALLGFPVLWKYKIKGILFGVSTLFLLNQIRILGLYFIGSTNQSWFISFHEEIFPLLFIIIALIVWLIWLTWTFRSIKKNESK